jgi:hypothetical protein
MNVSIEALQAAGGLLLLYVSLELLTGRDMGGDSSKDKNIALVPLGTPLLAGPGAIVATMIFVQQIQTISFLLGLRENLLKRVQLLLQHQVEARIAEDLARTLFLLRRWLGTSSGELYVLKTRTLFTCNIVALQRLLTLPLLVLF